MRALGAQVAAVAGRLCMPAPVAVACTGGVFAELDALRRPLMAGAGHTALDLRVPQVSALLGALLLAMHVVGTRVPDAAVAAWSLSDKP